MNDDIKQYSKNNNDQNNEKDVSLIDEEKSEETSEVDILNKKDDSFDDTNQVINEDFADNEIIDKNEINEFEKESNFKEDDIFEPVVEKINETNVFDSDEISKSVINEDVADNLDEEEIVKQQNDNSINSIETPIKEDSKDNEEKENLFKHSVLEQKNIDFKDSKKVKPPKKSFKEYWKNLKKPVKILAVVAIILIAITGALGITHAIITKDVVFIHSEEDLFKALEKGKGEVLYIKENVIINKDVTFTKPYDINLHGNTLTVNGNINYNLNSEDKVIISTIKRKQNINEGAIFADSFIFSGEKSTLDIYSDINAPINIKSATTVNFYSSAVNIKLEDLVKNFNMYGKAQQIDGGNKIVLYNGSVISTLSNSAKVIVQPGASVNTIVNVNAPIFVEKLEAPKNIMVDTTKAIEKTLVFTFNKVVNAYDYIIRIDGDTVVPVIRPSGDNAGTISEDGDKISVTYIAEQLVPNNYEVTIYAVAADENREYYLDSDKTSAKFTVSIQLPEPIIDNIDKENGKIIISFNQYVSAYIIKINNQSFTVTDFTKDENNKVSIDILDKISQVGSYSISVVAHSDHSYYSDSNPCYKSLVITKKLNAPVFNTVVVDGDLYTFSWQAAENAKFYKIVVTIDGESVDYYTSITSLTLSLDPLKTNTLAFNSVKNGYYLDSDVVNCPIDYVFEEIPEETPPEDTPEE